MAPTKGVQPPWLKKVLIPFWTIQLLFMVILIGVTGWAATTEAAGAALGILIIYMVFDAVCIILNITEIVLFAKKKLAPITYLVLQVVKTSIWTIVFIVYIVRLATIQGTEGYYIDGFDLFLGGDIEAIVLLLAFIATLIYASVIYHRHRRSRANRHRLPSSGAEASPSTAFSEPAPMRRALTQKQRIELAEREERGKIRSPERDLELEGEGGLYELDATRVDRFGKLVRDESGRSGRSKRILAELRG